MPIEKRELIAWALQQPSDAVMYQVSRALAETFPHRYVLENDHWGYAFKSYLKEGLCTAMPTEGSHNQYDSDSNDDYTKVSLGPKNSWYDVEWEGHSFQLVVTEITRGDGCSSPRYFLVGESREITDRFFLTVEAWYAEVRGEVLVYNGYWRKSTELFEDIQGSVLDNLILERGLKEQIRGDFDAFFAARETYERYGIPWKRGVLLLGPPGNGKTHCIKALVNRLKVPCLYVRTFVARHSTEFESMAAVFERARESAPCLLVFEDLDSMLNDNNRSFFLNELDGFESNSGIMIVATTNHPERLDPALLERPSRFDRKYTFNLPGHGSRSEYCRMFSRGLEPALQLDEEDADRIAALTQDFSFAYLRELFLSAMMAWIHNPALPFADQMRDNVEPLRRQMVTAAESPATDANRRYMNRWSNPDLDEE